MVGNRHVRTATALVALSLATPAAGDIAGTPSRVVALTGAEIVLAPGAEPISGTLVLRDGRIEAAGPDVEIPPGARVHARDGSFVYAGFIEPYLRVDPREDAPPAAGPVDENPKVLAHRRAADLLPLDPELLDVVRGAGYTAALVASSHGVFRGRSVVVGLSDADAMGGVLVADAPHTHGFQRGSWPVTQYPRSLMGAIALTRQKLLEARWLPRAEAAWRANPAIAERPETNLSVAALEGVARGEKTIVFECEDLPMVARALSLSGAFDLRPIIVSGGADEIRRPAWLARALRETGADLVVALNVPPAPFWRHEEQKADVELDDLVHWESAPSSPAALDAAEIAFAVTSQGLSDRGAVLDRLRAAIDRGLSARAALAALTTEPARILGLSDRLGTIAPGKLANLTVTSGPLFEPETKVVEVWIAGAWYGEIPRQATPEDVAATWRLRLGPRGADGDFRVAFEHDEGALSGHVVPAEDAGGSGGESAPEGSPPDSLAAVRLSRGVLTFRIPETAAEHGALDVSARVAGDQLLGRAIGPDGAHALVGRKLPSDEPAAHDSVLSPPVPPWPPVATGEPPRAVLVRGATIWTSGPDGVLEGADLLVRDGRIVRVGVDLDAPKGAHVIDGRGKHVTAGIIDCHSHSSITGGVNEATESSTAQVRIGDVVNPRSIAMYRELAGGLTVANLLHGSANTIGGQNAVVKLRWGETAQGLLFAEAPPGIKFALGENVKQSNWGDAYKTRYPQTRMGVEPFVRDRFLAARDHREAKRRSAADPGRGPVKPDLELEAILEIIDGERLIHCHAYRQDEMLMLMRTMESFGVTIGTFQHALESYKIADEVARHGAGVSLFSDWWAYKFEVYDAIPYAGAITSSRGVLTSYNSDSSELSRRLNLEAAKAVKYGALDEAAALAFVTINPARQLGIDRWVGSLERGKHGDFVVWSDHPLSDRARCEETWIEGVRRFSLAWDAEARGEADRLRAALLEKAASAQDEAATKAYAPTFGTRAGASSFLSLGACVEEAGGEVK